MPYYSSKSQPFSELGLLGPTQQIGGYPTSVPAGSNFSLYIYVGNHEGEVEYYRIFAKLGNSSSVISNEESLATTPVWTYDTVLGNNQSFLGPVSLSIPKPGNDVRLVFELWLYETNTTSFAYDHRFAQLYLNVTA